MYSTIFATVIHIFLAPYLAVTLDMKMLGISIATMIHFIMRFLGNRTICQLDSHLSRSFVSIRDPDSWKDLGEMAWLGWNSFLLKVMGWWAFDVFTQLAAFLAEDDVAAQTVLRNIGLFTYMIPVGLSSAMGFFVGNYIGKNKIVVARKFAYLCTLLSLIWSFLSVLLVWVFQDQVMTFYTKDEAVLKVMKQAWYVLTIFVFFDCMQGVAAG